MSNLQDRIREIVLDVAIIEYPDYNLGILPDEGGYDSDKEYRRRNSEELVNETVTKLTDLYKEFSDEVMGEIGENWL